MMRINLTSMTALAGSLILTAAVANAAPILNIKPADTDANFVDLVRQDGGGGGGGDGGGGGGAALRGGGDGGGAGPRGGGDGGGARLKGGGDGAGLRSGERGDGVRARTGRIGGDDGPRVQGGGRYADDGGPRVRRGPDFDRGDWNGRSDWKNGDKRRYSGRDDDRDGRNVNRHRVWRNGAWVWVYGPDIYAYGDDCWWLLRRAEITGSPYWWRRYEACVY